MYVCTYVSAGPLVGHAAVEAQFKYQCKYIRYKYKYIRYKYKYKV